MNKYQPLSHTTAPFYPPGFKIIIARASQRHSTYSRSFHPISILARRLSAASSAYTTAVRRTNNGPSALSLQNNRTRTCTRTLATMSSKLVPANPADVMVIRDITPNIATLSVPFARYGIFKVGGRATIGRFPKTICAPCPQPRPE